MRRVVEELQQRLADADFKSAVVSTRHLAELRRDFEKLLEDKCTCIQELMAGYTLEKLTESIALGFGEVLGLEPQNTGWSEKERKEIESMARSKEFRQRWME